MLFLSDPCQTSAILKVIYFIFEIMKLAFILVPIGLIAMITVDFAKNIMSNEDEMKKNLSIVFKRIMMCVALFFVPTIVRLAMSLVNMADPSFNIPYRDCIANANLSKIAEIEGYEETIKEQEKIIEEEKRNQALTEKDENQEPNKTISSSDNDNNNDDSNNNGSSSSNNNSSSNISSGAQSFLNALDRMSTKVEKDHKNGKSWHYTNSHTEGTFAKERKNGREVNCALSASWALIEIGILEPGETIYKAYNKKSGVNSLQGSAASKIKKSNKVKIIDCDAKTPKQLEKEGKLKPGDIMLWYNVQHTNVYAGNKKFYDSGHAGVNGCTSDHEYFETWGPFRKSSYYNSWKVWKVIRVKG